MSAEWLIFMANHALFVNHWCLLSGGGVFQTSIPAVTWQETEMHCGWGFPGHTPFTHTLAPRGNSESLNICEESPEELGKTHAGMVRTGKHNRHEKPEFVYLYYMFWSTYIEQMNRSWKFNLNSKSFITPFPSCHLSLLALPHRIRIKCNLSHRHFHQIPSWAAVWGWWNRWVYWQMPKIQQHSRKVFFYAFP